MISPSHQNPTQPEDINFFQRPALGSHARDEATKIMTILQDAHALQKLAESYDIDQFLNNTSAVSTSSKDIDLSAIATLAGQITKSLDDIVRSAPREREPISGNAIRRQRTRHRSPSPSTSKISASPKRCYKCGVTDTPRWRRSAPGCPLLCNFCSLVQTKRATRKCSETRAASTCSRLSWP